MVSKWESEQQKIQLINYNKNTRGAPTYLYMHFLQEVAIKKINYHSFLKPTFKTRQ